MYGLRNLVLAAAAAGLVLPAAAADLASPIGLCAPGPRHHCVVDGDTVWLWGERIRISNIDAPELGRPQCDRERALAEASAARLVELLRGEAIALRREGDDRFGRTLARVGTSAGDVGEALMSEGLARPWRGRREGWCAAG